jgi:hypothetical protein
VSPTVTDAIVMMLGDNVHLSTARNALGNQSLLTTTGNKEAASHCEGVIWTDKAVFTTSCPISLIKNE